MTTGLDCHEISEITCLVEVLVDCESDDPEVGLSETMGIAKKASKQ
jgi:hypothetical protein